MLHPDRTAQRQAILSALGASAEQITELLQYNSNCFDHSHLRLPLDLPLLDEAEIPVWQQYVEEASQRGIFSSLQMYLVQLQFPIQLGISQNDDYRAATLRGESVANFLKANGLTLKQPETLQFFMHQSLAGKIPVIVVAERSDFVTLVQALAHRNEPYPVPDSMGACTIQGLNNWDRIRRYQQQWAEGKSPFEVSFSWTAEFQNLLNRQELYQDRFIILSQGYYSNIAPKNLNLSATEWLETSLKIRLEHECTHYFTLRLFGKMSNNLWDELLADYWGIFTATGSYQADLFLRFMGLEDYPEYRQGGRLENYIQNQQLSNSSIKILHQLLKLASENLEQFTTVYTQELSNDLRSIEDHRTLRILSLIALTYLSLEQLADPNGVQELTQIWQHLKSLQLQ